MEARQRRSFTNDYKRQAVDLVASSGRSIGSVAKELGLRDSVLRRWVEQRGAGREPTAAARRPTTQATLPSADHAAEIARLQRENERLRGERIRIVWRKLKADVESFLDVRRFCWIEGLASEPDVATKMR